MKRLQLPALKLDLTAFILAIVLICAVAISWPALLAFDKIAFFGLFLLPFILRIDRQQIGSYRYVVIALVFALLYFGLGQSYWALACGLSMLFAVIELRLGRLNEMALYALLFYLPITRSFFMLFGFYIRIEITKWAAKLISFLSPTVSYDGTQIFNGGDQFSVDAGCMGLRLVITGFLLTLLILNQSAISRKIRIKPRVVSLFLTLSFLLIILANFFRIVALIIFKSAEGTLSHELIGVAALVLFHIIPMVLLIRYSMKQVWVIYAPVASSPAKDVHWPNLVLVSIALCMVLQVFLGSKTHSEDEMRYRFEGYTAQQSPGGIVSYSLGDALFTIKPVNPLSFSNHHPMICWRGDGFDVSNEAMSSIGEHACMSATLKSSTHSSLNTVWWYSNTADCNTTSELAWRLRALLRRESFYILNFTSPNPDELVYTINSLTQQMEQQDRVN